MLDKKKIKRKQEELNVDLKDIVKHPAWKNNKIKRGERYSIISKDTGYLVEDMVKLINEVKISLYLNESMVGILKEIKRKYNIPVICLSNMSKDDIIYLKNNNIFDIFDIVFNSGFIQMNKPEINIYDFIINVYNIEPEYTLFIDDNISNINMAKKHNFKTIHY
ncbi:Haloacid dehalogenase-like hydrolase-domain-containing protein, partial [Sporodiniella umbellata]